MKKRLLAVFIALIMVLGMLPVQVFAAESELPVNGNVVDIVDYTFSSWKVSQMTINGATIQSATQDGMTINVVLAAGTELNASVSVGFSGTGMLQVQNSSGKLSDGSLTLTPKVLFMQANRPMSSVDYSINFSMIKGESVPVTAPEGEGFTFTGKDVAYIDSSYSFAVAVKEGYDGTAMTVKVNGEAVEGEIDVYKIDNVKEALVITVEGIVKKEICNIIAPAGEGYTFVGNDTAYKGESYTFKITIDEAYDASGMVVRANGIILEDNNGNYTIEAVNEDTVIVVENLVQKAAHTVTPPEGNGFTFTGENFVYDGENYSFNVSVNGGFVGTNMVVKVNGEIAEGNNGTYTVSNVNENLTITVEGIEREPLPDKEIPVSENEVDITDKEVYKYSSIYYAGTTNITVSGATVKAAFENDTTVYFILGYDTQDNAEIGVTFGVSLNRCTMEGTTGSLVLENGEGSLAMTLKGSRSSSKYGTVIYNLVFLREEAPTNPPTRVVESDNKDIYKTTSITLELSDYFENALRYYLVDGDSKTLLEDGKYVFKANEPGVHTLVFAAENDIGECADKVTVTINVTDIVGGIWIGHSTSNGSLDFVLFKDADGNLIDGIEVSYENKVITVTLPKAYSITGKVTAEFSLTQNASGYPFLSTKTATSGTSSSQATGNKFTSKTLTLSAGAASLTFYYFNSAPNGSNQETFTLVLKVANDLPVLSGDASAEATVEANKNYELDLAPLFTDADGDALSYFVSINGAAAVSADENYVFSTDVAGTYTLIFTANDGKGTSAETYTVTLTVENSNETSSMTVYVPEDITPNFYASTGFESGVDQLGVALEAIKGDTKDGLTAYVVNYPINAEMISVRTDGCGGMAFYAVSNGEVTLRKAQFSVVDYNNNVATSTNKVTYGENTAVAGDNGWLLVCGTEYVFTATPSDSTLATAKKNVTLDAGSAVYTAEFKLGLSNPVSITVPTGAKAQLYKYNQYYSNTELEAKIIKDNGDGTTTYQFVADLNAHAASFIYRVSMEGKITKAGWLDWNEYNLTVTYTENDKSPSYRLDDYSVTGEENAEITEDSVLLNANSRNHLNLTVGESITLKAYRAWEIIPVSYNNYIIPPDFHFTVIYGNDVISLTEKASPSACDGDWMTLTALKNGIAIIEVTYDAIDIRDNGTTVHYGGVYGASDPNRVGLLVIQVGESNDTSVKFGVDGFTSIGTSGSNNVTYNPNNKKEWDVEFDTLYFLGDSGTLTFNPTASSSITEVAVSNDKGLTWTVINGNAGTYIATILPGNNIIRVKTEEGTAYQVVRGDKITVKFAEVEGEGKSNGDGIIEAGETVRVYLIGLHNPIPKMAGNYNPGYGGNNDGYSSQHINYTANGVAIYGKGLQYNFITAANYVEIVMPEDGSSVTLTDGYIGLGVIGLTTFADGGDSHRNIPDSGSTTRGSATTFHTRSILPEITIFVGDTSAPNNAPIVKIGATSEGSIFDDQSFAINPDTLFVDPDDNTMSFTVSVNGAEAVEAPLDYKFVPSGVGTYTLVFTATDGKESVSHTITVTVTERPAPEEPEEPENNFGLDESEIAGYVTISFEDNGIRVNGESGLRFPTALGTIIPPTRVPYKEGENIAQVTARLLEHLGIRMSYTGSLESGFYLGAIQNFEVAGTPYTSMGEFDAGVGSGWMITQNDIFIQMGASEFKVKDGDEIEWKYTCQLGADIGDTFFVEVNNVKNLINAIGTVTLDSLDAIEAARAAYGGLSDDQKTKVTNYDKLTEAIEAYNALVKKAEDDKAAAEAVEEKISAIGTVTEDSGNAIANARSAYDALTEDQKQLVTNLSVLQKAEADYAQIVKNAGDEAAANAVEEKISSIGTVTLESKSAIENARSAYEALSAVQKALVENLSILESAEAKLYELQKAEKIENVFDATGTYLDNLVKEHGLIVGSVGGEWIVIGLFGSDKTITDADAYYQSVVKFVNENINDKGQLHRAKVTENARIILALTALGYDVTNVGGHNLLLGLTDMSFVTKQGINGPIWTLIALDSHNYEIPSGDVTREKLIEAILDAQLADGGWTLMGESADVDMTAMALQALAPYYDSNTEVKRAVDEALMLLSNVQHSDGGFGSVDGANAESSAQVIIALTSLGIDPNTDARFVKNGRSVLDALCDYYVENGGFKHIMSGEADGMATEQSYLALVAYNRLLNGNAKIYDMNAVEIKKDTPTVPDTPIVPDTTDEDAANAVDALINSIGAVTLNSEEAIVAARTAYNALTEAQKALVENYVVLTNAEAELTALKNNTGTTEPDTNPDTDPDTTPDTETDKTPNTDTQPNTDANNDTEKKTGCGAIIGGTSVGIIAVIGIAAVLLLKKKKRV